MPTGPYRLAAWRGLLAASGLTGVTLAVINFDGGLGALSQQASLATGFAYLALAALALTRPDRTCTWVRGAAASVLALVAIGYAILLDPDYGPLYSLLEHLITPALVVIDLLVVQRRPGRLWWPLSWALIPIAYLVYYLVADLDIYGFLDAAEAGFPMTIAGLIAGFLAIAYALIGATRIRAR